MPETLRRALAHPGTGWSPAVLASSERDHRSGREVILGTAIGYELLIRLGLGTGPSLVLKQGLHPPAPLGAFGSTAAASKVHGPSLAEPRAPPGPAACQLPSTVQGPRLEPTRARWGESGAVRGSSGGRRAI